ISPWSEIPDSWLYDYYANYLSPDYKNARIKLEPGYSAIAELHGCDEEIKMRQSQHQNFIVPLLEKNREAVKKAIIDCLDFGGGSGKVIPKKDWIRSESVDIGNGSIKNLNKMYDFIQILHVLEHVGNPSNTLDKALKVLTNDGLVYIEVPWEMYDFNHLVKNEYNGIICDEHINKYCDKSIQALVESKKLKIELLQESYVQLLHSKEPVKVVKCLARRISASY
ncbi:MAG: methyltransferase domain-containing protein, partial [Bdellovibrionales bacterium]